MPFQCIDFGYSLYHHIKGNTIFTQMQNKVFFPSQHKGGKSLVLGLSTSWAKYCSSGAQPVVKPEPSCPLLLVRVAHAAREGSAGVGSIGTGSGPTRVTNLLALDLVPGELPIVGTRFTTQP